MPQRRRLSSRGLPWLVLGGLASACLYPELSTSEDWDADRSVGGLGNGGLGNGAGTSGKTSGKNTGGMSAAGMGAGGTVGGTARGGESGAPEGGSSSGPSAGSGPEGGSSTAGSPVVGEGGSGAGEVTGGSGGEAPVGGGGSGGQPPTGPYDSRSGTFKMLAYSKTAAFRHASISTGITLLSAISQEQGFTIKFTETNEDITAAGLAQYEIVFFMNTSGDVFSAAEQLAFEAWMVERDGAFAGVHSATDTESAWPFYSELTGQYYNGHGVTGTTENLALESSLLSHAALNELPNPWSRADEWFNFNSWQTWSMKDGFQILIKRGSDGQPVSWIREWSNFRSFYTSMGHDAAVFQDANVKKHVTGGIMWAVRREHCLTTPRPAGCP